MTIFRRIGKSCLLASILVCSQAIAQDELVIDGEVIDDIIDLFITIAEEPENWAASEESDPNGRPTIPGLERFVTLDTAVIQDVIDPSHTTPFRVQLRFLRDYTFTIVVENIRAVGDALHVIGRVRNVDNSRLSMTLTEEYVRGTLHVSQWVLEFRRADEGVSVIQVLDPTRFPMERRPRPAHRQPGFNVHDPQLFGGALLLSQADEPWEFAQPIEPLDGETYADTDFVPAEFKVLALKSAKEFEADECTTEALNNEAGEYTNNLIGIYGDYARGSVTFKCVTPPDTPAWTTLETIRQYLMTQNIKDLRDDEDADLVIMIVKDGLGYCGYTMYPDYPLYPIEMYGHQYKENAAFGVVDESCALGHSSFAHEIGHLLGMKHERFNEQGGVNEFCGYGYPVRQYGNPIAHTVMAYDDYCDFVGRPCSRVPYFSIPRAKHTGSFSWFRNWWDRVFGKIKGKKCTGQQPGHLRQPANNTRQLISSAELVAQYRP